MAIIISIIVGVVSIFVGFFLGMQVRKFLAESKLGSAEEEAKQIINTAIKSAETRKKETLIEAKEEIIKTRAEAEKEVKERRNEVVRQERWLQQKEEQLEKRNESLEKKEDNLAKKIKDAEKEQSEIADIKRGQLAMLEKISSLSAEQARDQLLKNLEGEIQHEAALKIKQIEEEVKETSDDKAREIVALSIQRCASDFVTEATVSVVNLPNDEMKGRIIGREGRNIRTIETMTGVDLIIDDTPEAITLSCFDPVRREVARRTLEKLISDGRIHPARIEETVEKSQKEVELYLKQEGERAVFETGVHGIHPELVKLIGRLRYRTSYGQNVLNHSVEVSFISGVMAAELGADVTLAKRAGLLHDLGKALDHEIEGSHIQIGVEYAKRYKEGYEVVHAIEAHHGEVEAKTVIACIVQAADAISAARPGARRENVENYIKRLERLEEITSSFAIQAGREVRIIVKPDMISDDEITILARDIVNQIEKELEYPGQIKINVIRENRAIDYAK
ncbi:MAG: ribonuclease Y [Clostridia bacterium]